MVLRGWRYPPLRQRKRIPVVAGASDLEPATIACGAGRCLETGITRRPGQGDRPGRTGCGIAVRWIPVPSAFPVSGIVDSAGCS